MDTKALKTEQPWELLRNRAYYLKAPATRVGNIQQLAVLQTTGAAKSRPWNDSLGGLAPTIILLEDNVTYPSLLLITIATATVSFLPLTNSPRA